MTDTTPITAPRGNRPVLTVEHLIAQLSTFPTGNEVRLWTHGQFAGFALGVEPYDGCVLIDGGWRELCTTCGDPLKRHTESLRCKDCKNECGINCKVDGQGRLV